MGKVVEGTVRYFWHKNASWCLYLVTFLPWAVHEVLLRQRSESSCLFKVGPFQWPGGGESPATATLTLKIHGTLLHNIRRISFSSCFKGFERKMIYSVVTLHAIKQKTKLRSTPRRAMKTFKDDKAFFVLNEVFNEMIIEHVDPVSCYPIFWYCLLWCSLVMWSNHAYQVLITKRAVTYSNVYLKALPDPSLV